MKSTTTRSAAATPTSTTTIILSVPQPLPLRLPLPLLLIQLRLLRVLLLVSSTCHCCTTTTTTTSTACSSRLSSCDGRKSLDPMVPYLLRPPRGLRRSREALGSSLLGLHVRSCGLARFRLRCFAALGSDSGLASSAPPQASGIINPLTLSSTSLKALGGSLRLKE